jgi:2-dehydro-3-deoxy-D-gluconate 5-dehydrogenase
MNVLDTFRLDGKVALVTGANRGLGQAITLGRAEAGAEIAGLERGESCGETCDAVRTLDCRYLTVNGDLETSTVSDLNNIVQLVLAEYGHLDILVNNAGIIRRTPAMDYSEQDWDATLQINLKAAFFLAQAAARVMREQGRGKIINIASLLSFQGGILVPAYTATKHGIVGLTHALANEWAPLGINVNAIALVLWKRIIQLHCGQMRLVTRRYRRVYLSGVGASLMISRDW